ncbi:isocitrate/isopropylmalate dehydrogenase family protein [Alloalcanivorax mobilis]|uniref:isocitrate/isopropylmalate dehydrogenase family protein n=1 Tax=Alloalcanivorax mobilis TaxID=2019569 RepID=UPI000B5B14B6|nr:isocitrate/isopropylmalate family dehydrogenase [Alloalcanivorax mobilis]ASK34994.1 3-isopropylmalate dehydrogenase [Alcanivorax sp. N3-2A]
MANKLRIALLPGDGIGPEVMAVAEAVLNTLVRQHRLPLQYDRFDWPATAWHQQHGAMMPDDALARLRAYNALLLGALGDPGPLDDRERYVLADGLSLAPLLTLRKGLDLWACERPARFYPGTLQYLADDRARDLDMLVIRENSEGEYAGQGGRLRAGTDQEVATQLEVFTYTATERLVRHAFERARQRIQVRGLENRERRFTDSDGQPRAAQVCLITKRNAQAFWGELYTRVFAEVAADYPDVATHHELVDAAAMKFVQAPWRFDVVVASNLHGDILTDLAAVLAGGLGVAPSANLNPADASVPALFEPTHGSAPDIAGRNLADPRATLFSLAMLLDHLAEKTPVFGGAARHLHETLLADLAAGEPASGTDLIGERIQGALGETGAAEPS